LHYPEVLSIEKHAKHRWTARDAMLYALGIGAGDDPLDEAELHFVTESNLKVLPTFATILSSGASPVMDAGIDRKLALHGAQSTRIHGQFPVSGEVDITARIVSAHDKGPGKGAVLVTETTLVESSTGDTIATLRSTAFARGDGGFGGPNDPLSPPHAMPDRAPDVTLEFATRPGQALLYRLSGDYNPLHSNPDVARKAGFDRPILHGLCTYGITGRAVIKAFLAQDPSRVLSHEVRFSAPVLPGDLIAVDLWREGNVISFEARVPARAVTVIRNGRSEIMG
jgi:acyl dehydratase